METTTVSRSLGSSSPRACPTRRGRAQPGPPDRHVARPSRPRAAPAAWRVLRVRPAGLLRGPLLRPERLERRLLLLPERHACGLLLRVEGESRGLLRCQERLLLRRGRRRVLSLERVARRLLLLPEGRAGGLLLRVEGEPRRLLSGVERLLRLCDGLHTGRRVV